MKYNNESDKKHGNMNDGVKKKHFEIYFEMKLLFLLWCTRKLLNVPPVPFLDNSERDAFGSLNISSSDALTDLMDGLSWLPLGCNHALLCFARCKEMHYAHFLNWHFY